MKCCPPPPHLTDLTGLADFYKALGHPTRLHIVALLAQGSLCACQISAPHPADLSTVSRHLAILRQAGIILSHREGQNIHYRLADPMLPGRLLALTAASGLAPSPLTATSLGAAAPVINLEAL